MCNKICLSQLDNAFSFPLCCRVSSDRGSHTRRGGGRVWGALVLRVICAAAVCRAAAELLPGPALQPGLLLWRRQRLARLLLLLLLPLLRLVMLWPGLLLRRVLLLSRCGLGSQARPEAVHQTVTEAAVERGAKLRGPRLWCALI